MRVGSQRKDPDSISLHTINWARWLAKRGSDTIAAAVWTIPAAIGPLVSESFTTTSASVRLPAKGVVGVCHDIEVHITTATGLEEDAVLQIRITNE